MQLQKYFQPHYAIAPKVRAMAVPNSIESSDDWNESSNVFFPNDLFDILI